MTNGFMSLGKPRPVTLTESDLPACETTWAAARMPTVVGATMTLRSGYLVSRRLRLLGALGRVVVAVDGVDELEARVLGIARRVVFMRSIHAFWLVAVAAAERIAISPVQFGASSQAQSARFTPTPLKSTWLTNTS